MPRTGRSRSAHQGDLGSLVQGASETRQVDRAPGPGGLHFPLLRGLPLQNGCIDPGFSFHGCAVRAIKSVEQQLLLKLPNDSGNEAGTMGAELWLQTSCSLSTRATLIPFPPGAYRDRSEGFSSATRCLTS